MDITDPLLLQLIGKIEALTILAEGGLIESAGAMNPDDPFVGLDRLRRILFSSMQNLEREDSDFAESVWNERAEALDRMFQNARLRMEGNPFL